MQDTGSATTNIPKGRRDLVDPREASQALQGKQSASNQLFPKYRALIGFSLLLVSIPRCNRKHTEVCSVMNEERIFLVTGDGKCTDAFGQDSHKVWLIDLICKGLISPGNPRAGVAAPGRHLSDSSTSDQRCPAAPPRSLPCP